MPELMSTERFKNPQPGTVVRLREDDVKADDGRLMIIRQALDQLRNAISAPRPAAHFAQALFVNVDDGDPFIDSTRHEQPDTRIIKMVLEERDNRNLPKRPGMPHKCEQAGNAQKQAQQGFLHWRRRCIGRRLKKMNDGSGKS